ncbi:MAG TPA: hypothetical protein VKR32_19540, partial [Puia sp.]|nr:hypothetical protein [Puia sp.]
NRIKGRVIAKEKKQLDLYQLQQLATRGKLCAETLVNFDRNLQIIESPRHIATITSNNAVLSDIIHLKASCNTINFCEVQIQGNPKRPYAGLMKQAIALLDYRP